MISTEERCIRNAAFFGTKARQMFAYALWKEARGEDYDGVLRIAAADEKSANRYIALARSLNPHLAV